MTFRKQIQITKKKKSNSSTSGKFVAGGLTEEEKGDQGWRMDHRPVKRYRHFSW